VEKLTTHLTALDAQIKGKEAKKKRQERQEKTALLNGVHPSNIITGDTKVWCRVYYILQQYYIKVYR